MGASTKPHNFDGRFHTHAHYLDLFLSQIKSQQSRIILVLHDWGSALGLHWAQRHTAEVAGLVLMEFVHPWPSWDDIGTSEASRQLFRMFRSAEHGRRLLIEENAFIEKVLPASIVRALTEAEMRHYRAPFEKVEDREPLYRFPNELPIEGQPADVYAAVTEYHDWLLASPIRKLFLYVTPGALINDKDAEFYNSSLPNCRSVFLGEGRHYIQEDHPHAIGRAISTWLTGQGS
ncbi:hypothetical protein LTR53_015148 [Teratosphaeriaceae sp. CCFEE 6253]|nr:hypothetical protein LTR53_015148 [Teratosphaeriaceae sp. CCFEE 6253]